MSELETGAKELKMADGVQCMLGDVVQWGTCMQVTDIWNLKKDLILKSGLHMNQKSL